MGVPANESFKEQFLLQAEGNGPGRMKEEADLRDRIKAICLEFPHSTATAGLSGSG